MDKNQFKRYREYDAMFRDFNEEWSKGDIISELAISEKTFNLDRRAMEWLFDVEIISIRGQDKNYIYRYADRDMSISEKTLTQKEVDSVEQAIAILSGVSGLELLEGCEDILSNLRGFESKSKIMDKMEPFVSFQTDNWGFIKNFSVLFNAIRDKQVLEINYKDFKSKEYKFELHPYFLKHYNEMWYLYGYNSEKDQYDWVLALDRIEKIEFLNKPFKENKRYKFDSSYFDDVVGITKYLDKEPVKIKLKVNPDSIEFVGGKPLNQRQKPIQQEEDGNHYTYITVRPNNELYNRLLMFGDNIEVIEPMEVRKELADKINTMANNYKEYQK